MPSTRQLARDNSVELGSPSKTIQYSTKTGRPIRRSAGKAKPKTGFVDSKIIEDVTEDPIESPSEDEDGIMVKAPRKRKRSPSPEPPALQPIIRDEQPDGPSDDEAGNFQQKIADEHPIVLQFNIPLGFHGPLHVKLDRSMLTTRVEGQAFDMRARRTKQKLAQPKASATTDSRPGFSFSDFPPEIRNNIYRRLFVAQDPLGIPRANNLCRSAQFLSTCKLVYSEGCSVLYSDNTFILDRSRDRRGPFWEPEPKEIGYTDVRRFLKLIGPENLSYLRDVRLVLEDACPSSTPKLSHEQRRYINDEHLIDILRILRGTKLRELRLTFLGRRMLLRTDVKFLGYLEQVKADEVSNGMSINNQRWGYGAKISPNLWTDLEASMARKKKLYIAA